MKKTVADAIKDLRNSLAVIDKVNSPRTVHITIPAEDARLLLDTALLVPESVRNCTHQERFRIYHRTKSFKCSKCKRTIKENW